MKKITIAAMLLSFIMAFTACGNTDSGSSVTEAAETESAAEIQTEADAEAETTAETDSEAVSDTAEEEETVIETALDEDTDSFGGEEASGEEESSVAEDSEDLYHGTGYTISVDPEIWMDASSAIEAVGEFAENADIGIDVSADDIADTNDGIFIYKSNMAVSFNVVAVDSEYDNDSLLSLLDEVVKLQYEAIDGFEYLGGEVVTINGYNCFKCTVSASEEAFGADTQMSQYMFLNNGKQYVITFSAPTDSYDGIFPDFEAVLNSFAFAE